MNRKHFFVIAVVFALWILVATTLVFAGDGPPEGNGNKGDVGKSVEGFLYGDLYVMERDGNGEPILYPDGPCNNGELACAQPLRDDCSYVPLVCSTYGGVEMEYWEDYLDVENPGLDPDSNTLRECLADLNITAPTDPEDGWEPELCDLHPCFLEDVEEVHFGRMSVARTTPDVVDKAYIEAVSTINSAVGVGQDLAGRLVLDLPLIDDEGVPYTEYVDLDFDGFCDTEDGALIVAATYWKTIDSPLENLALYREMMVNSCLGGRMDTYVGEGGDVTEVWTYLEPQAIYLLEEDAVLKHLVCDYPYRSDPDYSDTWWQYPDTPAPDTPPDMVTLPDHDLAATFVAAAGDKAGHLTLDMIVNANTYLEINTLYQENPGQAPTLTYHQFFEIADTSTGWYQYNATTTHPPGQFAQLLAPAETCSPGCFCVEEVDPFADGNVLIDLANSAVPVCRGEELLQVGGEPHYCRYDFLNGGVMTAYFPGASQPPTAPGCGGANWFTQAAEDARETIWYLHNFKLPDLGACIVP